MDTPDFFTHGMRKNKEVQKTNPVHCTGFIKAKDLFCFRNLLGLWAFFALLDFKRHCLTFCQGTEAVSLDRREMYKYIITAIIRSNKTKTF